MGKLKSEVLVCVTSAEDLQKYNSELFPSDAFRPGSIRQRFNMWPNVVFRASAQSGQDHRVGRENVAVKECKPRERFLKILPDAKISQLAPELQSTQDCSGPVVTLLERVDEYWLMLRLQHKIVFLRIQ